MGKLIIYEDTCKGCELCVRACPHNLLALQSAKLNAKGYHPIGIEEMERCIGCAACAKMCPDVALEVEREPKAK